MICIVFAEHSGESAVLTKEIEDKYHGIFIKHRLTSVVALTGLLSGSIHSVHTWFIAPKSRSISFSQMVDVSSFDLSVPASFRY